MVIDDFDIRNVTNYMFLLILQVSHYSFNFIIANEITNYESFSLGVDLKAVPPKWEK